MVVKGPKPPADTNWLVTPEVYRERLAAEGGIPWWLIVLTTVVLIIVLAAALLVGGAALAAWSFFSHAAGSTAS